MSERTQVEAECIASPDEAKALVAGVDRTLARDLEMVAAGNRKQSDLHVIRPKLARIAIVRWTASATVKFRL